MHTRPIPWQLVIAEADECWKAGEHGNPVEGSHLQEKCPCNRTKSNSYPLGDYEVWHDES